MVDVKKEMLHINGVLLLQRPRIKANRSGTCIFSEAVYKKSIIRMLGSNLFHDDQKSNMNNNICENLDNLSL